MKKDKALKLAIKLLTREYASLAAAAASWKQVEANGPAKEFAYLENAYKRRQEYDSAIKILESMLNSENMDTRTI